MVKLCSHLLTHTTYELFALYSESNRPLKLLLNSVDFLTCKSYDLLIFLILYVFSAVLAVTFITICEYLKYFTHFQ